MLRPLCLLLGLSALPACRCLTAEDERPGPTSTPTRATAPPPVPGSGPLPHLPAATAGWRWATFLSAPPPAPPSTLDPKSTRPDLHHAELHLVEQGKTRDYYFSIGGAPVTVQTFTTRAPPAGARPLWRHELRCHRSLVGARHAGVLWLEALGGSALLAACFPPRGEGYQVHALDARTGEVRWMVEPRPPRQVEREQQIQLGTDDGKVTVYGRNAVAPFVDVLDPATGRPVASAAPPRSLTRIAWRAPRARSTLVDGAGARYSTRFQPRGRLELRRTGPGGGDWRATVQAGPFARQAALALDGERLYVVAYCGGASGAALFALDRARGTSLWKGGPYGVGPIGHSRYSNTVGLEVIEGHPVLFGEESGGRYIEAFDPRTGRSVAAQRFY